MKVSEAIEKLTKKRDDALHFKKLYNPGELGWTGNESKAIAYSTAINVLQQIDEPQAEKVEVPDFVAKWFKANKISLESNIAAAFRRIGSDKHYTKGSIYEWLNDSSNEPIQTLLKMKNGYTVEQPKRWVVKVGNLYFCGWEDTTAQFVMNTALGEDESIIKYKNEGTASSVAKNLGGTVEKVLVEGSVEEV